MCKSREIHRSIGYYDEEYRCNRCGYHGTLILDVEETGNEPDPPVPAASARRIAAQPFSDPAEADNLTDNPIAMALIVLFIIIAIGGLMVMVFR
jgi:hypothetical protein